MSNSERAQRKIVGHLRRVQAQIDEIERHLSAESNGMGVIKSPAKARGEINVLMAEMLAGRIQFPLSNDRKEAPPRQLGADLVDLLRPCLK